MSEADILKRPAGQVAPLLIRDLFFIATRRASSAEILYADRSRYSYATFADRVHRLAGALTRAGDASRHDRRRDGLGHAALPGMLLRRADDGRGPAHHQRAALGRSRSSTRSITPRTTSSWSTANSCRCSRRSGTASNPARRWSLLNDAAAVPETSLPIAGEYEALLAAAPATFDFPDLDENTRATTFYTTGTTGLPKGVYFSHRQLVLHTLATRMALGRTWPGPLHRRRRLYAGHADVPRPRLGAALHRHRARREADLSRPLRARRAGRI